MATILNNAAYMALPMNIKRGNPIPLDTTTVWYSKTELENYAASGATSYVGQVLTLVENEKCEAYLISNTAGTLIKLASTTASGDLASDVAALQTQVNSLIAKVGTAKEGDTTATGLYKSIDDLTTLVNSKVSSVTAADATIAIGGNDTAPTIKVQLSPDEDNAAKATANGLKVVLPSVTHPEYSIVQLKTANDGMSASYSLTKDGVNVGTVINIPKDMVVKSGSVVVNPQGQSAGTYIELVLANAAEDKLYVKVDDLIEYVTSGSQVGDSIVIHIDENHQVTASITDGTIVESKLSASFIGNLTHIKNAAKGPDNGSIVFTSVEYDSVNKKWKETDNTVTVAGLQSAAFASVDSLNQTAQDKVDAAKTELRGTAADAADAETIQGAKAWGTSKANDALAAAKTYTGEEIAKLGYTDKPIANQFVTEVQETNGKIEVKRSAISADAIPSLAISKIDGLQDALDSKQGTITFNSEYNASTNKAATMGDINAASDALVGAAGDTKESDTIRGAKLYASDAAQAAKDYADSLVTGDAGVSARVSVLEGKVDVDKVSTAISSAVSTAKADILGEADYEHTVKDAYELANGKTTLVAVQEYADAKFQTIANAASQHEAIAATVATAQSAADEAKAGVATINTKLGTVPDNKTIVGMIADAQTAATYDDTTIKSRIKAIEDGYLKAVDKTELQGNIDTISAKVTTLIGDDASKSVRTIANEELVKQLIPENASASLDTLQEIAAWIQNHPSDVATINKNISDLQAIVDGIGGEGEKATVVAYVDDKISALKIGDYAKAADLTAATDRIAATEGAITKLNGDETTEGSVKYAVKSAFDTLDTEIGDLAAKTVTGIYVGEDGLTASINEDMMATIPYATDWDTTSTQSTVVKTGAAGVVRVAENSGLSIVDGGTLKITAVNAMTLYVNDSDVLILNGGSAATV